MGDSIALLDSPKRLSLQSRADVLRGALKEYERDFAAEHAGSKPGKNDIKTNASIAAKYKEYNRLREVLAGKRSLQALSSPGINATRKRHARTDSAISLTPQRYQKYASPSKSHLHPSQLDPYDSPSSFTPKVVVHAIGPTPRRDGTVLGIFDLLSNNSGSGRSSAQETPSSRKRKIDAIGEQADEAWARDGSNLARTPSQRKRQSGDAAAPTTTPRSGMATGKRQHLLKTPVSDSKRFMLDHFFATPSADRFSTMLGSGVQAHPSPAQTKTPLRDLVLGHASARGEIAPIGTDATPPYLKRAFSFKERLLSASADATNPQSSALRGILSPTSTRRTSRGPRHVKFAPKPLSQIIADMQKQNNASQEVPEDEDDLEALREIEANEANVLDGGILLNDGSAMETPLDNPAPVLERAYKKKGQKRTTRRVIMRPAKVKVAPLATFVGDEEEEEDDEDELALDADDDDQNNDVSQIEETQLIGDYGTMDDPEMDYLIALAEQEVDEPSDVDPGEEDDFVPEAEEQQQPPSPPAKGKKRKSIKGARSNSTGEADSIGKAAKGKHTTSKAAGVGDDGGMAKKINPNAYSHMNFRSLKIKNKNSKAKGRGRFGRRR